MIERGMIFNGEMVRAILDGRKTQTRRIMAIQPEHSELGLRRVIDSKNGRDNGKYFWSQSDACGLKARSKVFGCPYGEVGDRIWVRETFQGPLVPEELFEEYRAHPEKFETPQYCEYSADGGAKPEYCDLDDNLRHGWRPSIHMPRWASRILLEITNVGVQRLQSISPNDAAREGLVKLPATGRYCINQGDQYFGDASHDAREVFSWLWASIYGEESWNANPWVWVIEFKRIDGGDHATN
ncbi:MULTISPECIES: hypothetical protein [Citrobacter]|uniref:Morphogenetic protein n=1 Tax=Citrobacter pasteurii TaxID=1563222 RepID=A0ABX8K3R0_9ENTR|nr:MULTISPECIES: hypothetical protein [Citrobacter]QXA43446.1 morphogenetic protein [Citrobacter pasteurii]TKU65137.1 morphogenetic protein [Citrobacter sp. wls715]CEJ65293.1 Phage-related protein [Citrobacter pasteurii]